MKVIFSKLKNNGDFEPGETIESTYKHRDILNRGKQRFEYQEKTLV